MFTSLRLTKYTEENVKGKVIVLLTSKARDDFYQTIILANKVVRQLQNTCPLIFCWPTTKLTQYFMKH